MMNRYTEISLIAKPVVYITLQEICDTHSLLLKHRHQLADSENDKLNELLDDLGEEPSLCSLLGALATFFLPETAGQELPQTLKYTPLSHSITLLHLITWILLICSLY